MMVLLTQPFSRDYDIKHYNINHRNRIRGIEIRGNISIARVESRMTSYAEYVKLILRLDAMSMMVDNPNPCDDPVQKIVFCLMVSLNTMLTDRK
jgi:hypothetical protein